MNGTQKTKTDEANKEKKDKRSKLITKLTIAGAAAAVLLFAKFCPMKEEIARTSPQADQQTTCPETKPCPPCPLKPDAAVPKPDTTLARLVPKPDTTSLKPPKPPAPTVKRCDVNGKWERVPGKIMEQCDPEAKPTGCKEGQTCTDKCKCKGGQAQKECNVPKDQTKVPRDVPRYYRAAEAAIENLASKYDGKKVGARVHYCMDGKIKVELLGDFIDGDISNEIKNAVKAAIAARVTAIAPKGYDLRFEVPPGVYKK